MYFINILCTWLIGQKEGEKGEASDIDEKGLQRARREQSDAVWGITTEW